MYPKLTLVLLTAAPATAQISVGPFYGQNEQARMGTVVERIGDVDSDGTADFAVGAPFSDETVSFGFPFFVEDAGAVWIYSGVDGSLIWKAVGPVAGSTEFGAAIADAGDVNKDGHDDVLVGLPTSNGLSVESGSVKLLSGADGATIRTFFGSQTGERYGATLCAGHMDTDFLNPEAAIGAPFHDAGGSTGGFLQEGRVEVVDLWTGVVKADIVGSTFEGSGGLLGSEYVRRGFGSQLEYLEDSDANGFGSLLVSAPFTDFVEYGLFGSTTHANAGLVQVFEPLNPQTTIFSGLKYVGDAGDLLGMRMEVFDDDLNGDGGNDWAIYAPGSTSLRFYQNLGLPLLTIHSSNLFGLDSLASVGDVDQDGTPDIAVGIPGLGSNPGSVRLLSGVNGLNIKTINGAFPGGQFGAAVAGADMDGNGAPEIWIGAPSDDTGYSNAGVVHVYTESSCHLPAYWTTYGQGTPGTLGVPSLTLGSSPIQGTTVGVKMESVTTVQTTAVLLIGAQKLQLPVFGGTVLVSPIVISSHTLPITGTTVGLAIPEVPQLCGQSVFLQAMQLNPDTQAGWAFSPGVEMALGS